MASFLKNNIKNNKDKILKYLSSCLAWFLVLLFIIIIIFIIISAIPGFQEYGLDKILGTLRFNVSEGQVSIWAPLSITLLVSFGSLLLATPIAIKTATFIKFRLKNKYQKFASILVQSLSGIPSVIFGLFAINSLGPMVTKILHIELVYSIVNAIIMLTFMILPTIVAMVLNTYNGISNELIFNPIGLGTTRTKAIYQIYKRKARSGIIVAVVIALGRAIGETMALSMILTSESYSILNDGIGKTLSSSLGTLGSIIATNMFSETGGEATRGVLYAFGIFLFIFIMLLNTLILFIAKNHNYRTNKFFVIIEKIVYFIPNKISLSISNLLYKKNNINNRKNNIDVDKFISYRIKQKKMLHLKTYWYISLEFLCAFITFGFLIWISLDILINGFGTISNNGSTIFNFEINTTGQAIINTLIIIIFSLSLAIPISLLASIYLNEFAKEGRSKKIILFFIDSLGSSPSIIFGMFGLTIFIEMLGLTIAGSMGKSLLAGSLTISIVILPTLIRTIQQSLASIPIDVRINSYALGCSKWTTIWKIVIPSSIKSLSSAIIFAISRIIAETAPLYLTAGLSPSSAIGLLMPGQTLTTRIYAQLSSSDINAFHSISYECALIAFVLIIILIWIGYYLIPNSKTIKNNLINLFMNFINTFLSNVNLEDYHCQIINRTLYLSYEQADKLKLNKKQNRLTFYKNKLLLIKYISKDRLLLLKQPQFIKDVV